MPVIFFFLMKTIKPLKMLLPNWLLLIATALTVAEFPAGR